MTIYYLSNNNYFKIGKSTKHIRNVGWKLFTCVSSFGGCGGGGGGRCPNDLGRPAVPEVSHQLLRENVVVRSPPSFFFGILDRN